MISFSKQPQCDEGSEQIPSFSINSKCELYNCMWIQRMCRYRFARLTSLVYFMFLKYSNVGPRGENKKPEN